MGNGINENNILIILGDSKPIYYLSEILIVHYHSYIEKTFDQPSQTLYDIYLPIIQIAESKVLDEHKICNIKENNCITSLNNISDFKYVIDIIQGFSQRAPHVETSIIRQLLKIGTMDIFFHYFYIRRNPSSYETIELLLRSIIDKVKEKNNAIFNVFILVFTREPESTYNAYAELLNVLRGSKLGINKSDIRIQLVETGLVGSEEEFLRRHYIEFIGHLSSQVHPYSRVSPQIPIYNHASELMISYARSLARSEFKIYDHEEGGGIYHICTPNTPLTLLATLYYLLNQNRKDRIYYNNNIIQSLKNNGNRGKEANQPILIPDIIFSTFHRCPRYRLSIGHKRGDNWSVNYIFRGIVVFKKFKIKGTEEYNRSKYSNNEYVDIVTISGEVMNNSTRINPDHNKNCPNRRICIISLVESSLQKTRDTRKNDILSKHYTRYEISSIKPLIKIDDKKWILYVKSKNGEKRVELEDTGERYPAFVWACIRGFDNWRDKPGHSRKDPFLALIESLYPLHKDGTNPHNYSKNSRYVLSLEMHGCLSTTRSYNRIALVNVKTNPNDSEQHVPNNKNLFLNRLLIIPIKKDHYDTIKEYVEKIIYSNIDNSNKVYKLSTDKNEMMILIYRKMFSCDETRCPLLKYKPYVLLTDITHDRLSDQLKNKISSKSILLIAQIKNLLEIERVNDGNNNIKRVKLENEAKEILTIINKISFKVKISRDELNKLLNEIKIKGEIGDENSNNNPPALKNLIVKVNIDVDALLDFINNGSKRIMSPTRFNFINRETRKIEEKVNGIIDLLKDTLNMIGNSGSDQGGSGRNNTSDDEGNEVLNRIRNVINGILQSISNSQSSSTPLIGLLKIINEKNSDVKGLIKEIENLKRKDDHDQRVYEDIKENLKYIAETPDNVMTIIDKRFYNFLEKVAEFLQVMVYKDYPVDVRLGRVRTMNLDELL